MALTLKTQQAQIDQLTDMVSKLVALASGQNVDMLAPAAVSQDLEEPAEPVKVAVADQVSKVDTLGNVTPPKSKGRKRTTTSKKKVEAAIKAISKDSNLDTVLPFGKAVAKAAIKDGVDATCEVEDKWVWVTFGDCPSAEIRKSLKDSGFFFSGKFGSWGHTCGTKKTWA